MTRAGLWTLLGACAVAAIAVFALHPWVVRPLDASGAAQIGPPKFDAKVYVDSIWASKVLSAISSAAPAGSAGNAPQAAFYKGQGRVVKVDTTSRAGVAEVELSPPASKIDVELQIGPVTPGTAVRDALGLSFEDFDTQIDFANVADALNERAIKGLPLLADPASLQGKEVSFVGAGSADETGKLDILPVSLELAP